MTIRNLPLPVTLIMLQRFMVVLMEHCEIIQRGGNSAFRDKTTKTDGRGGKKRERAEGTAAQRDDEGEVRGELGVGLGINRNKDKGQWRESGGKRRRRRVEGTEVRVWTAGTARTARCPFASCYIRSQQLQMLGTCAQGPSAAAAQRHVTTAALGRNHDHRVFSLISLKQLNNFTLNPPGGFSTFFCHAARKGTERKRSRQETGVVPYLQWAEPQMFPWGWEGHRVRSRLT